MRHRSIDAVMFMRVFLFFGLLLSAVVSLAAQDGSIRQVSYGKAHLCVIGAAGELVCWGSNQFGQVGNGKGSREQNEAIERNPSLIIPRDVTSVSVGSYHTCAVAADALFCWGSNTSGEIGNGNVEMAESKNHPKIPLRVIAEGVKSVSAGGGYTCAVVGEELQCWGANWHGQIGIGAVQRDPIVKPTRIIEKGVTAVATSSDGHSCAVVRGDLLCWGYNEFGQVGTGSAGADVLTPTKVLSGGVTAVSLGGNNTCAVRNGALWCWGENGDEIIVPSAATKAVANPREMIKSGVTSVSIGTRNICAVVNGGLQCWGRNHNNMLGTDSDAAVIESVVKSPREMLASGVTLVSVGEWGSCAVVNGALRCRGSDAYRSDVIRKADFSSYRQSAGDVQKVDHSAADIAAEMEKSPPRIADRLKGKIIVFENVVYLVSAATGDLGHENIAFGWSKENEQVKLGGKPFLILNLNVIPLLALKQQPSSVDDSSSFTLTISPEGKCGLISGLPASVNQTGFYLLEGNRFAGLHETLQSTNILLPAMHSPRGELKMDVADVRNVQSCAEKIHNFREKLPYRAIQYQVKGEEPKQAPIVPDGSRQLNIDNEIESIYVESKANDLSEYRIAVQSSVVMQCKDTVLDHWKEWLSPIVEFPGYYSDVSTESLRLRVVASSVVNYSDIDLRRALNAVLGKTGVAAEQDVSECLPMIRGQTFEIRYRGEVIQRISAEFKKPKPLLNFECGHRDEDAEVRCKPLPNDRSKSIMALTFLKAETETGGDSAWQGNYDLGLFIVKTDGRRVYSQYHENNAYVSDAIQFQGLSIDTARYELTPALRAFGLRASYSARSFEYQALDLFVQQGAVLKKVLAAVVMHRSGGEWTQTCTGEVEQLDRTIEIGQSQSHGFSDLVIHTTTASKKMEYVNDACVETQQASRTEDLLLKFDGEKYVIPADLR